MFLISEAVSVALALTILSALHFVNGLKDVAEIAPIIAITTSNSISVKAFLMMAWSNVYMMLRTTLPTHNATYVAFSVL